jgi:hypothetical protein
MSNSEPAENAVNEDKMEIDHSAVIESEEPMDTLDPSPQTSNLNGNSNDLAIKNEEIDEAAVEDEDESESEDIEEPEEDVKQEPKAKVITHVSPKMLYQEPAFAEICSFFNMFGAAIGLKYSIEQLENLLCTHVNGKGKI